MSLEIAYRDYFMSTQQEILLRAEFNQEDTMSTIGALRAMMIAFQAARRYEVVDYLKAQSHLLTKDWHQLEGVISNVYKYLSPKE